MKKHSLKITELAESVRAALAECKTLRARFDASDADLRAKKQRRAELMADTQGAPDALARELSEIAAVIDVLDRRTGARVELESEALESLAKSTAELMGDVLAEALARFDRKADEIAGRVAKGMEEQGLKAIGAALLESLPLVKDRLRVASTMDTFNAIVEVGSQVAILRDALVPDNLPLSLQAVLNFVRRAEDASNAGNYPLAGLAGLGKPAGEFLLEHPEIKALYESACACVVLDAELRGKKSVYNNFNAAALRDADLAEAVARANRAFELAAVVGA